MTHDFRFTGLFRAFLAKSRQLWLFPVSLVCTDLLLAAIVISLGGSYWIERAFTPGSLSLMAGIVILGHGLSLTYAGRQPRHPAMLIGKVLLGNVIALALYCVLRGQLTGMGLVSRSTFGVLLLAFAPLQMAWHLWHRRRTQAGAVNRDLEPLRWALIAAVMLLVHLPLESNGSIGAGDSYWYSIMVADFVSQWRAGIFPVFAGQTEFAFNGAISPLRFAPALQHTAGVIDLLTCHSLPFYGLLNLTLLTSFVGGAFTCYFCLRAIEPRTPWLALVLSLLFSAAPGVLALAYVGDLFMSVTTLPYLPILFYGAWRTLTKGDLKGTLIMVSAAAALWYCHPPIALWGTLAVAITQLVRLARDGGKARTWQHWLIGLGCFGVLSFYSFYSVLSLGIPAYPAVRPVLIETLRTAFPAALLPLSQGLVAVSDYQLGWSLWGALLAGAVAIIFTRPRLAGLAFLAASLTVLAFLLPTPLLDKLWLSVPQAVCDITFMWPMQRLYVVLAALSVFLMFATLAPVAARRRYLSAVLLAGLLAGAAWSGLEVRKFQAHAILSRSTPNAARQQHSMENRFLTRYAFNPFRGIPPYYSHGVIDPYLQNRLLSGSNLTEVVSNGATVENDPHFGLLRAEGVITASRPDASSPTLELAPRLVLEPHRRYVLKIDFDHPEFKGALRLAGERMARVYWMPDSGFDIKTATPSRAFGSLPGRPHSVTIWTDGDQAETIGLYFYFLDPIPTFEVTTFGHYTLREYAPAQLPIAVEQWAPYRARFKAPTAVYLETPRIFLDGYRATVNGQNVPVTRSPSAQVMIPVPAGDNVVELSYQGTPALQFAYFLSLTGWIVILILGLRSGTESKIARSAP